MIKKAALPAIALLCLLALPSGAFAGRDTLTQVSTIDALLGGLYDGVAPVGSLREAGDLGIGTFHALDGELVMIDGQVFQVRSDGSVRTVDDGVTTPFAAVTFFDADRRVDIPPGTDFTALETLVDGLLPTDNLFYAFRMEGRFRTMKTRSVHGQQKPYRPLVEVVKQQPIFDFSEAEGTIVGFRCPAFVKGINVPGYHLHFLSADRKAGGHVLAFEVEQATLAIDPTAEFTLRLPETKAFTAADLTADRARELQKVEK